MIRKNAHCHHLHNPVMADTAEYQWPVGTVVTYRVDTAALPNGMAADEVTAAIVAGIESWPKVCGVVTAPANSNEPRVLIEFALLDSSLRELGLTELPPPGIQQVSMKLNLEVAWTPDELQRVSRHEFGHALGLGHSPQTTPAVMDPYYRADIDWPQPWDIAQAVERYSLPVAGGPVEPATPPPPIEPKSVVVHVDAAGTGTVEIDFPAPGDYVVTVAPAPKGP